MFKLINQLQELFGVIKNKLDGMPDAANKKGLAYVVNQLTMISKTLETGELIKDLQQQLTALSKLIPNPIINEATDLLKVTAEQFEFAPQKIIQEFTQQTDIVSQIDSVKTYIENLQIEWRKILQELPSDAVALSNTLANQLALIINQLAGPEAQTIITWYQTAQTLAASLAPISEAIENNEDVGTAVLQLVEQRLLTVLDLLGYLEAKNIVDFVNQISPPPSLLDEIEQLPAIANQIENAYQQLINNINAEAEFATQVETCANAVRNFNQHMESGLNALTNIQQYELLQPGAINNRLHRLIDKALAIEFQDARNIEEVYTKVFTAIDSVVKQVNVKNVISEFNTFFVNINKAIKNNNFSEKLNFITNSMSNMSVTATDFSQQVLVLNADLKKYVEDLLTKNTIIMDALGKTENGVFKYNLASEVATQFDKIQALIVEGSSSESSGMQKMLTEYSALLKGYLDEIKLNLDLFKSNVTGGISNEMNGINSLLNVELVEAFNTLETAINTFKDGLSKRLNDLAKFQFSNYTNPIVEAIEANTAQISQIDVSSLSPTVRKLLAGVLEVNISINLHGVVNNLTKEWQQVIQVEMMNELKVKYAEVIGVIDKIQPQAFFKPLFANWEKVKTVILSELDEEHLSNIKKSLNSIQENYLQQPLAEWQPKNLLRPVKDNWQGYLNRIEQVKASAIIGPVDEHVNKIKTIVNSVSLSGQLDEVAVVFAEIKQKVTAFNPEQTIIAVQEKVNELRNSLAVFNPATILKPAIDMAPSYAALTNLSENTIKQLYELFSTPLQILDQLNPKQFALKLSQQIDNLLNNIKTVNVFTLYQRQKAAYLTLYAAALTTNDQTKIALVVQLDPALQLFSLVNAYNNAMQQIGQLKNNFTFNQDLVSSYEMMKTKLDNMLPFYAREVTTPEVFQRMLQRMNPQRFLAGLNERFNEITKAITLDLSPLSQALITSYQDLIKTINQVDVITILDSLEEKFNKIKADINQNILSIDFLQADLEKDLTNLQQLVRGLDPTQIINELDEVYQSIVNAFAQVDLSKMIEELAGSIQVLHQLISDINLENYFQPIFESWVNFVENLKKINLLSVLDPVQAKFTELTVDFNSSLQQVETAFDAMLSSASSVFTEA